MSVCGPCGPCSDCGAGRCQPTPATWGEILRNAAALALFCGSAVGVLAVVNHYIAPVISKNDAALKQAMAGKAAQEKLIRRLVPAAESIHKLGEWSIHEKQAPYFLVSKDGSPDCYVIQSYGKGFGGLISVLIAVEPSGTVRCIDILQHSETPGMGDQVTGEEFRRQFCGKRLDGLKISTTGEANCVQAVTAATISSTAVCEDAVRSALTFLQSSMMKK